MATVSEEATAHAAAEEFNLTEEEVLACSFEQWYECFKNVTPRSTILTLPDDFVAYLRADGIELPAGCAKDNDAADSDSDWGDR